MVEEWKPVVGYESLFMVSTFGNVMSIRGTPKLLKQHVRKNKYKTIATKVGGRNGTPICFKVHRLVADAFLENELDKPYVNHIDANRLNNNITNLEWCTAKENYDHMVKLGNNVTVCGEDVGTSKFSNTQAAQIKKDIQTKKYGVRELALLLNVNHATISRISAGKTY